MTETKQSPILTHILNEALLYRDQPQGFLAVFDLDSTLFDLSRRVQTILNDFANSPDEQEKFPDECERLKRVKILPVDWGIENALTRAGFVFDETSKFYRSLISHWHDGFFSDDYLEHDEPLPGAIAYVNELKKRGAHLMYLTGRDIPRMFEGTVKSLRSHGFPLDEKAEELILKPIPGADDAQFKVDVLKKIEDKYQKIWLFENEPVNIQLVIKECPKIGIVFIDSCHSGLAEVPPRLETIRHFS